METAIRLIIMVFFIALVAIGIIMFAVFTFLPAQKLRQTLNQSGATSTITVVQPSIPTQIVPGAPASAGYKTFEIDAAAGKYLPDTISINAGEVLTIYFKAIDREYNISFPDFGVDKTIAQGQTGFIQFQATAAGTYKFYCKDICETPMTGSLIIKPAQ